MQPWGSNSVREIHHDSTRMVPEVKSIRRVFRGYGILGLLSPFACHVTAVSSPCRPAKKKGKAFRPRPPYLHAHKAGLRGKRWLALFPLHWTGSRVVSGLA